MPHQRSTRRRVRDAIAHASVPCPAFFYFFSTICADSRWRGSYSSRIALNRADLRRLGLYRAKSPKWPIQAEIQKKRKRKRKRCKTHRLNLITNPKGPKLSHAFSLHSNFSSLSFISLCCVLSASLSLRHSATQSHTQSHSQLTLTLTRHNLTLNSLTTSPTHSQSQVSTLKLDPLSRVSTQVSN